MSFDVLLLQTCAGHVKLCTCLGEHFVLTILCMIFWMFLFFFPPEIAYIQILGFLEQASDDHTISLFFLFL